ncbi:hypothetical protein B0H16DRAFT_1772799 [Mycena metata]|uniref:Uncharacterized protein n=1 Tax=Mycena metata TaxID=1033252 RepID=A0AAD7I0K2_9AGAR|nr:hypothetical protein B0H16DRAFT_1772799 [Mycena metata]
MALVAMRPTSLTRTARTKNASASDNASGRLSAGGRAPPSSSRFTNLARASTRTTSTPSSPATYGFDGAAGSPPRSYGYATTARPRPRSGRHFSASTPPSASSSGHGHGDLTLARTPSRLGGKPSLLDKAVRYLLDGDPAPDRNTEDILLMGVQLPGWGPADEARVALASAAGSPSSPPSESSSSHGHGHGLAHRHHKRGSSKDLARAHSPLSSSSSAQDDAQPLEQLNR